MSTHSKAEKLWIEVLENSVRARYAMKEPKEFAFDARQYCIEADIVVSLLLRKNSRQ